MLDISFFVLLPNMVMEAMAAAKPVVATDSGGPREILNGGTIGYLVPRGSSMDTKTSPKPPGVWSSTTPTNCLWGGGERKR